MVSSSVKRSIIERAFFMLVGIALFMCYNSIIFHQNYGKMEDHPFALTSLSLPLHCKYDVFPSFHGPDVRRGFLSRLIKEFQIKEIDTFIDNKIERSKSIVTRFIKSIRGSKVAIVVISRNYASSTWCLSELAEIMSCREMFDQIVMVIFYDVDPSDVKKQIESFGSIFRKTCAGKKREDIVRWRRALSKVATISGYHSINWDSEAAMIEQIANDVSSKLNCCTVPSRGDEKHLQSNYNLMVWVSFLVFFMAL